LTTEIGPPSSLGAAASWSKNGVPPPSRTGTRSTRIVEQSGLEALPGDRAAVDADHLVAGALSGDLDCALEALAHEREGRVIAPPAVRHAVGEDDDRHAHRMVAAPAARGVERRAATNSSMVRDVTRGLRV
jgi:hypothetical protein